jgi:hypothetical protein
MEFKMFRRHPFFSALRIPTALIVSTLTFVATAQAGTITVPATSKGAYYTVPTLEGHPDEVPLNCETSATGNWTHSVIAAEHGANGDSRMPRAPRRFVLPGAPVGGLIAIVSGRKIFVGADGPLVDIMPRSSIHFVMNDDGRNQGFRDNRGQLRVSIECYGT